MMAECLKEIDRAAEQDPLSMIILTDAAKNRYLSRQYDAAIEKYRKSLQVEPNFAIAHKGLAEVYVQMSMFDEAIEEIEKAIDLSKRSVFILDDLGYIYAKAGSRDQAQGVLDDLKALSGEEYVPAYGRAAIYVGLGDKDKALDWLEKAYDERGFVLYLKVDPIFDPLRNEKRFVSLLDKMGLGQ
jgi:tetratricopeptide (TPR) repeat protein